MKIGDKVRIITKEEFIISPYSGSQIVKYNFLDIKDFFNKEAIIIDVSGSKLLLKIGNAQFVWDAKYVKSIYQEPYKWKFTSEALRLLPNSSNKVYIEIKRDCDLYIYLKDYGFVNHSWLEPYNKETADSLINYKVDKTKTFIKDDISDSLTKFSSNKLKDDSKLNELAISFIKGFCSNSKYPSIISSHNDEDENDSESLTRYRKNIVNEAFLLAEEVLNKINNNE